MANRFDAQDVFSNICDTLSTEGLYREMSNHLVNRLQLHAFRSIEEAEEFYQEYGDVNLRTEIVYNDELCGHYVRITECEFDGCFPDDMGYIIEIED